MQNATAFLWQLDDHSGAAPDRGQHLSVRPRYPHLLGQGQEADGNVPPEGRPVPAHDGAGDARLLHPVEGHRSRPDRRGSQLVSNSEFQNTRGNVRKSVCLVSVCVRRNTLETLREIVRRYVSCDKDTSARILFF